MLGLESKDESELWSMLWRIGLKRCTKKGGKELEKARLDLESKDERRASWLWNCGEYYGECCWLHPYAKTQSLTRAGDFQLEACFHLRLLLLLHQDLGALQVLDSSEILEQKKWRKKKNH